MNIYYIHKTHYIFVFPPIYWDSSVALQLPLRQAGQRWGSNPVPFACEAKHFTTIPREQTKISLHIQSLYCTCHMNHIWEYWCARHSAWFSSQYSHMFLLQGPRTGTCSGHYCIHKTHYIFVFPPIYWDWDLLHFGTFWNIYYVQTSGRQFFFI